METISVIKSKGRDRKEAQRALYHKLVEDQQAVRKYFDGEYTLQELHAKGIKFVKPF